jgi:hypothetical protein
MTISICNSAISEEVKVVAPEVKQSAASILGVVPPAPVAIPAQSDENRMMSSKSRLTFMDSHLFDVRLGKEMESGKDMIEVDVTGRVPLSNIPGRIDKWVVKSAEEGKVELLESQPAPKTRFLFSLMPMAFSAYGAFKNYQEERTLDRAKGYDTKIFYRKDDSGGDTLIEKIVLTKRK